MATPGQIAKVGEITKGTPRKQLQRHISERLPELLATDPRKIDPVKYWESLGWIYGRYSFDIDYGKYKELCDTLIRCRHMDSCDFSMLKEALSDRSGRAKLDAVLMHFGRLTYEKGVKRIANIFRPLDPFELIAFTGQYWDKLAFDGINKVMSGEINGISADTSFLSEKGYKLLVGYVDVPPDHRKERVDFLSGEFAVVTPV
jgi:hypothetical protein